MAMIRFGEATHGWWCGARTRPIRCPSCRAEVFWFSCDCRSSVLFDDLGSPWPVHDCDDHVTRVELERPNGDRQCAVEARIRELETLLKQGFVVRNHAPNRSS